MDADTLADDLEYDVTRLTWLADALRDVLTEYNRTDRDYPFLADETATAAEKELPKVLAKIEQLKIQAAQARSAA
jgi:hypothetical protein